MAVLSNTMMQGTAAISDEAGAYQIEKSLRFNSADSPYLRRKPALSGNGRIFTISFWFKLNQPTGDQVFFGCSQVHMQYRPTVSPGGTWYFRYEKGSSQLDLQNNESLRDHSAWYHMVFAVDTTQATAADRIKVYINGKPQENVTGSYPDQNDEMRWGNRSYAQSISRGEWDQYAGMQFSDFYTIDGLQLSPAAFGSFDSTGVWNPKAFALPAPNNGTEWSDDDNWSGGEIWSGAGPAPNAFDGDLSTKMLSNYTDTTIHWTPPEAITYKQRVRIYIDTTGYFKINDTAEIVETTGSGSLQWETIYGSGTIEKLTFQSTGGDTVQLAAVEVDGVILVDDKTDPDTRNNPNNGTVWSDHMTGSANSGAPVTRIFDGKPIGGSGNHSFANDGNHITFIPPSTITGTKIEIHTEVKGSITGTNDLKVNGTSIFNAVKTKLGENTEGWYDIGTSIDSTDGIYFGREDTNNKTFAHAIRVDGNILIDSSGDNSFHLKFNDTTKNRYLGKDTLNGKIADATGGLPIYNTTDDYGDVKGSGYRADSSAGTTDGAGLVLAVPGDTIADVHHNINTGSSEVTLTAVNDAVAASTYSRFYGSSLDLDGNSYVRFESSDIEFGTNDFTIEFWFYSDTNANIDEGLFTTSNTSSLYQGSVNNYSEIRWSGASGVREITCKFYGAGVQFNSNFSENQWNHFACSRTSGTLNVFLNGTKRASGSCTSNLSGEAHGFIGGYYAANQSFTGSIQDFRIYRSAKYTSNFTVPTRNDFSVYNLTAAVTEYESPGGPIWSTNSDGTTISSPAAYNGTDKVGADKLVLALPGNSGDTSNSNYLDHSLAIAGTGSTREVTTTGVSNTTSSPKWYGSCLSWDGTGDVLKITDRDTDWQFGTGDFTIEFWADLEPFSSNPEKQTCLTNASSSSTGWVLGWREYSDGTLYFGWWTHENDASTNKLGVYSTHVTNGGWKHIAVVRYNGTIKFYVNGTQEGSTSDTTNYNFGGDLAIGVQYSDSTNYSHADGTKTADYRIYKGFAKYTSAFTPDPSSPYNDAVDLDSLTDTPTNYGTDTGAGGEVRGNYCSINPLIEFSQFGDMTLSQGNLKAVYGTTSHRSRACTFGMPSGKWYFEWSPEETSGASAAMQVGVVDSNGLKLGDQLQDSDEIGNVWCLQTNGNSYGSTNNDQAVFHDNGHASITKGHTIGVAIDIDAQKIWYSRDGVWNNIGGSAQGNPATGANPVATSVVASAGDILVPAFSLYDQTITFNFGQRAFKYTAPSGFKALCTQNLDDLFSGDELNNPSKYFDVKLITGTNVNDRQIEGWPFGPDLVWCKTRNNAASHKLYDKIRGVNHALYTDLSNAPNTNSNQLSAWRDDGYDIGTGENTQYYDGGTGVHWGWDLGTAASGANTNGSINIDSGNQWVNNTAGISMTKYEGTGANATVGHGLSTPPEMIIIKGDGDLHWPVYTKDRGNTHYWLLDVYNISADSDTYWQDTSPTNTVFSIGTSVYVNQDGTDFMAYCFTSIPGYSKVGSYTGSGVDPNFVYLGFSPKFLMVKPDIQGENWCIWDSARTPYNQTRTIVRADTNSAETESEPMDKDFVSNGFTTRTTSTVSNEDNTKYYYIAFAEHPFKTARAR